MLDYFPLSQVVRQTNIEFSTTLTKIGNGQALTAIESQMIESRFTTTQWCDENLPSTIRLFHQNFQVDAYNYKVLQDGEPHVTLDEFTGYSTNDELVVARTKLHKFSTMEANGLTYCAWLKVGHPYMITVNVDAEDGLVNGAIGTLKYYHPHHLGDTPLENSHPSFNDNNDDNNEAPNRRSNIVVWQQFDDQKTGALARRKVTMTTVNGQRMDSNWTPINERSVNLNLGRSVRCKRAQLPLAPACAITIHKSQGATFKKIVVSYERSQSNQLVYVALSRVESLDGLYLINPNGDHTFHHKQGSSAPSIKEIRDEYQRL